MGAFLDDLMAKVELRADGAEILTVAAVRALVDATLNRACDPEEFGELINVLGLDPDHASFSVDFSFRHGRCL